MIDLGERLSKQIRKELGIHDNSEEPVAFLVRDLATLASHQQADIDRLTREENAYRMEIGALKCALQEFVTSYDYWLSRRREDGKPLIDLGENARALLQGGKC
jgi:hypothetical protein